MSNSLERGNFGTKLGVILATAGGAVGLGNVWRFPYVTGQNGGAAFILIYFLCVLIMGVPVMLCEFLIGRHAQTNTARAYSKLANGTPWKWVGYMGVLTAALIIGYYGVVSGWTLQYVLASLTGQLHGTPDDFRAYFSEFSTNPIKPIIWMTLLVGMTHYVIVHGIEDGIEKASKIMMPLLFLLLLVLVGCSLMLPGAMDGVEFLLKPDFSKVTGKTFLEALGQSFFSLSIAMGCLCTYASYFKRETNLVGTAFQISIIDTFVAILAGLMIFPAAMAALTSNISLHEVSTSFLSEELRIGRRKAATFVSLMCVIVGAFCSLSLGGWEWAKLFGMPFFDLFDWFTANICLPLGGFFTCLFIGWYVEHKIIHDEITNWGTSNYHFFHLFVFVVKYICPLFILFIFLHQLGWV